MTAYIHGTSTRKVDDLVRALGCDSGVSKSTVSRICGEIDEQVAEFRQRSLAHTAFPYVFCDATYVTARVDRRVVSRAVVVATGVAANGHREVLGVDVGDLRRRGLLDRVPARAARPRAGRGQAGHLRCPPGAEGRRGPRAGRGELAARVCRVHFVRNALAKVTKGHAEMVAATIRTIFVQPDADAARAQLHVVADMLADRFPAVVDQLVDAEGDLLAYTAFPRSHWRRIWSTNPLERVNTEIKRRSNVVGIFPNDDGVIRLVGAVLLETHDEWQVAQRAYFSEHSMAELATISDDTPTKEVTSDPQHALPAA